MFSNKLYSYPNSRTYRSAPLAVALSAALAFGGCGALTAHPQRAMAEDIDTNVQADAAQQEVERTAAEYDRAISHIEELNGQIDDNEQRIEELEESLPEQQQRSSAACVKLYKTQASTPGLIEMVLSSQNIVDFFTSLEYLSHVFNTNQAEINRLGDMKRELEQTRQDLQAAMREADAEADNAAQALSAAQEARQEAQRKAQEEAARQAEEAARQAEEAARAQAEAEEKAAQEAQQQAEAEAKSADEAAAAAQSTESTSSSSSEVGTPTPDGADWSSDKATFVSEWTGRIDSYLAGSPMAGTGEIFAEAAWDYGVDPRYSPAISNTESTKGLYCFNSHNAWGWGSEAWDSWEDAIRDHVAGLARGYGYTISVEAAKKYCPANWEHWYSATSAQMDAI